MEWETRGQFGRGYRLAIDERDCLPVRAGAGGQGQQGNEEGYCDAHAELDNTGRLTEVNPGEEPPVGVAGYFFSASAGGAGRGAMRNFRTDLWVCRAASEMDLVFWARIRS